MKVYTELIARQIDFHVDFEYNIFFVQNSTKSEAGRFQSKSNNYSILFCCQCMTSCFETTFFCLYFSTMVVSTKIVLIIFKRCDQYF